jgi:hypothetical protein
MSAKSANALADPEVDECTSLCSHLETPVQIASEKTTSRD